MIKELFKQTQILHLGLTGGCLMIGLILVFLVGQRTEPATMNMMFFAVAMVVTITAISMGFFLYSSRIKAGRKKGNLEDKLVDFRSNSIVRWALIEGTALISILLMFIEGNYYYLIFYSIAIVAFLLTRPSSESFIKDYQLSSEEESNFRSATRE